MFLDVNRREIQLGDKLADVSGNGMQMTKHP